MKMMITPNFHACKEEKKKREVKGEYRRIWGEEEGDADYSGMVRPSLQDAGRTTWKTRGLVGRGLGTEGLRILAAFAPSTRSLSRRSSMP